MKIKKKTSLSYIHSLVPLGQKPNMNLKAIRIRGITLWILLVLKFQTELRAIFFLENDGLDQ